MPIDTVVICEMIEQYLNKTDVEANKLISVLFSYVFFFTFRSEYEMYSLIYNRIWYYDW